MHPNIQYRYIYCIRIFSSPTQQKFESIGLQCSFSSKISHSKPSSTTVLEIFIRASNLLQFDQWKKKNLSKSQALARHKRNARMHNTNLRLGQVSPAHVATGTSLTLLLQYPGFHHLDVIDPPTSVQNLTVPDVEKILPPVSDSNASV